MAANWAWKTRDYGMHRRSTYQIVDIMYYWVIFQSKLSATVPSAHDKHRSQQQLLEESLHTQPKMEIMRLAQGHQNAEAYVNERCSVLGQLCWYSGHTAPAFVVFAKCQKRARLLVGLLADISNADDLSCLMAKGHCGPGSGHRGCRVLFKVGKLRRLPNLLLPHLADAQRDRRNGVKITNFSLCKEIVGRLSFQFKIRCVILQFSAGK